MNAWLWVWRVWAAAKSLALIHALSWTVLTLSYGWDGRYGA